METRVVNKRTHIPTPDDVYIGRPGKWGNPFVIGRDGTRDQVCTKYRQYIYDMPGWVVKIQELRGKNLVCFCAPLRCHGDELVALLEST